MEGNLYAVNASPPLGALELSLRLWHSNSHQEESYVENLHQDVRRGAKALVKKSHWDGFLHHFGSCTEEDSTSQAEKESTEAHKLIVK